jgi:PhzF family phenazine biosynthesis protein
MPSYRFRILNVFAETTLGGNPLAVFENAAGLDSETMQALALQFNLSETSFILPSKSAMACVRIFTPGFEMPFAGHPTLGTAHVVRTLAGCGDKITLEMQAGIIAVEADGNLWTLTAQGPRTRPPEAGISEIAAALGIEPAMIAAPPLWVDTGSEQLVVPLGTPDAVRRCRPDAALLQRHCDNGQHAMAYVWAPLEGNAALVRFFFLKYGSLCEDPGTGSACANLGGYLLSRGAARPLSWTLHQGEQVGRSNVLKLEIAANDTIRVGGRVVEIGGGEIRLP